MPYGGKPSRGCQKCIKRKVKCDETKPACLRCLKSKTLCAYRDQTDLNFRNQTDSTAKAAQIKWRQRAKQHIPSDPKSNELDIEGDHSSKGSETSSDVAESIKHLSLVNNHQNVTIYDPNLSSQGQSTIPRQRTYLSRRIDLPLEATAIGLLFSDYILPEGPQSDGFLNFIPGLYSKSPRNSVLRSTVNTMALANIANKHDLRDLKTTATAKYCKTLQLLNAALKSPSDAVLDETLITSVLLMMYETITCDDIDRGSIAAHIQGAVSLLKQRGDNQFKSPVGIPMYNVTHTQMVIGCLFAGQRPGFKLPDKIRPVGGPGYIVDDIIYDAATVRANFRELEPALAAKTPESLERLKSVIEEAEKLELQYEIFAYWKDGSDQKWRYDTIDNSSHNFSGRNESIINAPGAPEHIHIYMAVLKAMEWNLYRAARVMLNQTIITSLRHLLPLDPMSSQAPTFFADLSSDVDILHYIALHNRAEAVVDQMIEDICASVAYHISPAMQFPSHISELAGVPAINGFFLLWPLAMMMMSTRTARVGHFKSGRREWIRSVLECINRGMGISQAGAFISRFY